MTGPHIVRHLDFWLECLATFPTWEGEKYAGMVRRYREALESL
jgi:hypothetical protein